MSLKYAVIKATLCDRKTELIPRSFARRFQWGSKGEIGGKTSRPRRRSAVNLLLLGLSISFGLTAFPQEQPTEYQIKAAFLFNFAKFVEWPPEAFPGTNSPIVIGVLGPNVFGDNLEKIIHDRRVNNRPFQFKNFTSPEEAAHCHILFISSSEKDNFKKILHALNRASVLTVSETEGFIQAGGMVNFTIEDSKIRFQISDEAAKKAGLRISSKLLSLALPVR